ncbi:MAG: DUF134 domain-containing protein [Bacteroidales bacterium]|nr:DUF134 domain-containing protein [Bacteroidales bacterium]MCF8456394.1 DUF134 domain-containing protein [Bacteroidales bacterium]
MPRRKRVRKVVAPPLFRGYKPYGVSGNKPEAVELLYEEYEAIKLADYDLMNHQEACVLMGVSRPTFARIYESARRKIALALVEAREIKSVYGNAHLDKSWLLCVACHARFTIPGPNHQVLCPICKSIHVESINGL